MKSVWTLGVLVGCASVMAQPLTGPQLARFRELDAKPLHELSHVTLAELQDLQDKVEERGIPARIAWWAAKTDRTPSDMANKITDLEAANCVTNTVRCVKHKSQHHQHLMTLMKLEQMVWTCQTTLHSRLWTKTDMYSIVAIATNIC